MSRILVTGSSGLVGTSLLKRLAGDYCVRATSRSSQPALRGLEQVQVPNQGAQTDWSAVLLGDVEAVVHLAARVHVMKDRGHMRQIREANIETNFLGTMRLAQEAARSGVRHFIYMSTAKVSGEASVRGRSLKEVDRPNPTGPYAESKLKAEEGLWRLSLDTGMKVTVIRPPLVYGPGVGGNFGALLRYVRACIPLPLGSVDNRRSFIFVDNLTDFVAKCLVAREAEGQTFFVTDDEDLSTSELLKRLAVAMGKPSLLMPIPESSLRRFASLVGKASSFNRLLNDFQLSPGRALSLGWRPPVSMCQGLRSTIV